jgi:hypothetical protein
MSNAKLVVLYPQPTDPETFEKAALISVRIRARRRPWPRLHRG